MSRLDFRPHRGHSVVMAYFYIHVLSSCGLSVCVCVGHDCKNGCTDRDVVSGAQLPSSGVFDRGAH